MNWTDFSVCTDSVKVSCRPIIYLRQVMGVCLMLLIPQKIDDKAERFPETSLCRCETEMNVCQGLLAQWDINATRNVWLLSMCIMHMHLFCSSWMLILLFILFSSCISKSKMMCSEKTSFGVLYCTMSSFANSPPVMMMCVVSGRSVTFNQYDNVAFYSGALNHSCTSTAVTFR